MKNYYYLSIIFISLLVVSCDQFAFQEGINRGKEYEKKYKLSSQTFPLMSIDSDHILGYDKKYRRSKFYFKWVFRKDTLVNYFTPDDFSIFEIRNDTAKNPIIEFVMSDTNRTSGTFFKTENDLQDYLYNHCSKLVIKCNPKIRELIKKDSILAYRTYEVQ